MHLPVCITCRVLLGNLCFQPLASTNGKTKQVIEHKANFYLNGVKYRGKITEIWISKYCLSHIWKEKAEALQLRCRQDVRSPDTQPPEFKNHMSAEWAQTLTMTLESSSYDSHFLCRPVSLSGSTIKLCNLIFHTPALLTSWVIQLLMSPPSLNVCPTISGQKLNYPLSRSSKVIILCFPKGSCHLFRFILLYQSISYRNSSGTSRLFFYPLPGQFPPQSQLRW